MNKKLANVQWGEYRLGDLFEIKPTRAYKKTNAQLFDTDGNIPVVTNSSVNNGVSGYSKMKATEKGNIITYSDTTTSEGIFYQPYDFVGYSHIQGLYPKLYGTKWNDKTLLFIVVLFKKVAEGRFNYGNKFNRAKAREFLINLPQKNGEIDFEFMESFVAELEAHRVAELEAHRVAELEAYLLATGIKDYKLTKYDENILDRFEKLYDNRLEKNTEKIRLEDILDWQVGIKEIDPLKLNLLYQEGKKYPFYGQATENNGIINYVSLKKEVLNNKNSYPTILIHSNNQNIVYLDTPFYLKDGHGATSVLQNKNMTYKSALYFMGAIKKVIKERFDYNSKATKIGLKNTIIELPIDDKSVDYKFMEDFITVVQKLVIKDVVLYADRKIEATRQVIER